MHYLLFPFLEFGQVLLIPRVLLNVLGAIRGGVLGELSVLSIVFPRIVFRWS